jgi:protein kinase-like protein
VKEFLLPRPTFIFVSRAAQASEAKLILGRYRPLRPLGSGGSGSVWLARDERSGRQVALKIVPREGNAGTRAEREAATAARLRHKRCVRAYALARDAEHVYIAYEYIPGRTLREALRSGRLNDRAVLEIALQVLEGLTHAHAHGIVHRDVKPSNVLLAEGSRISAHLLDFGLALINEEETLTAVGDVPGTLAYISPERLRGKTATPAADVWSVGVLLWEALAGRHPFWKVSLLQTARSIESGGAPSLARARPDLPRRLTKLVDRALSVEPSKRPTAAKLATGLRRAGVSPRRRRSIRVVPPGTRVCPIPALAAGLYALYGSTALPFYPHGWPALIALLVAGLAAFRPRAGLTLALAVPVLPLGNIALGLALVYGTAAAAWLASTWRRPRDGLLFVLGPLLAPFGGLGLLPLALERVTGRVRRAALAAVGVLAAGLVSGLTGRGLPFTGDASPADLRIDGSKRPLAVAEALRHALAAEPALLRLALVVGASAAVLPLLRGRSPWWTATYGGGLLALCLLPAPQIDVLPLVLTVWATCTVLILREERVSLRSLLARARLPVRTVEAAS